MSTVGNNILNRRKALGMTQEELAKRMGYKSKSTINKIELGINDIPQSKVIRFAEVLETTPEYLMGWKKEEKINTPDKRELTESEEAVLNLFRQLTEENQQVVLEWMKIATLKHK